MTCPSCGFVATPGQEAVPGVCDNCQRPYRGQPTPLNSEMEMRDMPGPGEEDTGGNPLQEGILGEYQNRGVRDESFGSMLSARQADFFGGGDDPNPDGRGYQGYSNWDTWNTKLMLDNEREHAEAMREMAERGGAPEEIRDYALHHVIGPHNADALADAQEWNSIPEEERLDPHYEELKNRNPEAADLVNNLGFGPDVSDSKPNLIDPEMVNWPEIHQSYQDSLNEDREWEAQKAKEEQEYGYGAGRGWSPEVMKMVNAWMPYHGAPARRGPNDPMHVTKVPLDQLNREEFNDNHWNNEVAPQGYWPEYTDSLGYQAAINHLWGTAKPHEEQAMQAAMQQAGYSPEEIAQITKQRYERGPNGERIELNPPPPASPNKSLDEPGNTFLPSNWTASVKQAGAFCPWCGGDVVTNANGHPECTNCYWDGYHNVGEPEFETTQVITPDPESIRPDKERMDKKADFLNDALDVAAPVAGGLVGSIVPGVGTALGAGIGAGLAGGGMEALQGGNVGQDLTTGLTDAALGGMGGAAAGGLAGLAGQAGDEAAAAGAGALGSVGADSMENAAANGVTRGGIGSLMKSAWSRVPTQRIKDAYMMNTMLNNVGGGAQQMTQPQQNMMAPANPSIYSAVETPTSHDEIPSNNTDDPEEVDFHENEGEKDPKLDTQINDIGGTDLGPDDFFSPDSGGLASFVDLLPKILDFALSDKSAAGDPDMEELHQKLEAEKPGYMNSADDDHGHKMVVMLMGGQGNPLDLTGEDEEAGDDTPHDPLSEHEASAMKPGLETICPACGGVMDASTGHCPQCGMINGRHDPQSTNPDFVTPEQMMEPQPMTTAHTAGEALTQGPNTDQQKAAVAELLQEQGRSEEIPLMLVEPWKYGDELAQVTQQEQPPETIGQEGPPPPVNPAEQQGQMPMPGMSSPEPSSGPQMMAAVAKYAATVDGFCEKCPKCDSHSTGYIDYEEGDAGCKACGHTWKAPKMVKSESHVTAGSGDFSWGDMYRSESEPPEHSPYATVCRNCNHIDPGGAETCPRCGEYADPLADLEGQEPRMDHEAAGEDMAAAPVAPELSQAQPEMEQEQTGSLSWTDESGAPLKVGQSYELYSQNYDIPDRITVTAVKPDVIEYTINGEYGLSHQTELTHEEAQVEGDSFVPVDGNSAEPVFEENQGAQPMDGEVGQQSDLSTPHELMVQGKIAMDDINGPYGPSVDGASCIDCNGSGSLPSGATCPTCRGSGSNEPWSGAQFENARQDARQLDEQFALPEAEHPLGPHTGYTEEVAAFFDDDPVQQGRPEPVVSRNVGRTPRSAVGTGPDWLIDGTRTAGAHMSPLEQRNYIEEVGDARNADKLQLGGTHYEMDDIEDSFLFGL